EEGKAHIEAALTLAGDDHAALAHIHNNMGYVLLKQAYAGNRSSAEIETQLLASINEHLIARAFAQSAHEMDELQGIENNLGSLYERVGELRNASQHYRESLKLIDPAPNPYGARVIYWNLGNLSQKLGDYLKARSYVEAAKTLVPANEANVAQLYDCMLGRNYRLMADYDKAIAIHRQCRQSAMQAGKTTQQLEALADLADDYVALARQQTLHADNGSAAANLQQAWQLISEAKVLLTAGNKEAGARVDKTAAANACEMDTANDNDAQGGAHNETDIKLSTKILSRHAQLAGIIGEIAQARTSLAQAAISANSASYPEQIEFLSAAIAVYRAAGDRAAMLRCGERALAHVEALHADLAADRNGAAWSARTHEIYVTLADMLLDAGLAQDEPSATAYQQQALAIVERSRAINLRQQLAMPRVADVASREQQKLRTNLDKIAADSAAAKDMSEVLPTAYYHQYDLLELARLENVKKVPVPPPLSLREIQQRLDAKQRVLYYFIAEQDCYLFEITARTFSVHRLGSTAELQSLLDPVVASDKTPSAFPLAALRKLGHFLLPATLATANAAELVIVPHRGLDTLPFAALQLPGTDDYEPLVNRFAIKEVPSLSAYFMKKPAHSVANRKDIAVFADPVFARDDLATADADAMTDGFRSSELQQDAFRNWTGKLERLPYTGIEAKNLVMAFDKGKVLEFTGERATLDNLVSPAVRAARILHIATHGYFHSTSSDNVGLVLSAVDEHHNEVANFVTLSELLGHNFDNELVVISGCDTAMGLELNGEGMFGLTRGFLAQGAGQVISTLWPVSDRASAEFMKLLYGHLLETRNVAQALQQAQRDLSRNPAYRSPYYWAGYVLSSVTADPVIGVGR
ncbi:MAG TPA: CHAT domain-containing tetratricopeptide repeat protein, partial [Candidatus Acidoferrum sp.]|nr:CHAT domain-containing tetratricopeptide repeat protein [Candidatus Acidoferrum sp.]